jgi:glycosyltransferase involved in cell wall biosynthesis
VKILHLIYTHGISGAEKYLKHLLPGLKEYGIECHLIVVCPVNKAPVLQEYCDSLNELGITTSLITSGRFSVVFTAKKISNYLKANQISILHAHLLNSDFIAAIAKSLFFRKLFIISTKHGYQEKVLQQYEPGKYYKPPNDLYYYITKYTLSKINKNIAVSKGIADLFYNIKLAKTPYPYIHHGIKVDPFDKEIYREECKKAYPQLIIVGRIELFKGHHFLLAALPMVVKEFPHTKLLILGEGSEKNNCIAKVNELGLQDNVAFLGFKPHPYSYISHSDVIILPSLFEPFGLVYIEAFALQTPVVAFDTPAGNEIMVNNETALLVDKGDTNALAQKIIYLLKNAGAKEAITQAAYAKYNSSFTTAIMIKNTAEWYNKNLL